MARITVAQVQAQLATANARIAELEQQLAAREARIATAVTVFKAQRATIRELESKLNTRGVKTAPVVPVAPVEIKPIVTQYTDRFGHTFERTRVGNRASIIQIN